MRNNNRLGVKEGKKKAMEVDVLTPISASAFGCINKEVICCANSPFVSTITFSPFLTNVILVSTFNGGREHDAYLIN